MDDSYGEEIWKSARAYNKKLTKMNTGIALPESMLEAYEAELDITGTGIMGYIRIDKIDCELPIYHGTSEGALRAGVGHLDGTSLPVGGKSTHCVLSGHTGLPSAELFDRISELEIGDTFTIQVLEKTLTYEVDDINIVLPEELSDLKVEKGEDLCTLVTCTPYGINTHRLLIRGHRIEAKKNAELMVKKGIDEELVFIGLLLLAPLLILILLLMLVLASRLDPRREVLKFETKNNAYP